MKHNEVKCIMNEGMPQYKNPFEKGRLIVQFTVKFPSSNFIMPEKLLELEMLLPPRPVVQISPDAEEVQMIDIAVSRESSRHQHRSFYDEDDDDVHRGPPGVQCRSA